MSATELPESPERGSPLKTALWPSDREQGAAQPRNIPMKWHVALAVTSVTLAVGFLLLHLHNNGFWIDELYTLHSIRLGWREMVLERLHRGHFPGYFALVRLWYSLWPETQFELALRSFSVLFYLGALASFWPLARRVIPGPAALFAVTLFACNNVALRQASEARMYTVALFLAVWITRAWCELQLLHNFHEAPPTPNTVPREKRWRLILILATFCGFLVSATIGVLVGSMLLVELYNVRRGGDRRIFKAVVLALLAGLAVFIPGAVFHVETAVRVGVSSSKPAVFLAHIVTLMPGLQIWDDYY